MNFLKQILCRKLKTDNPTKTNIPPMPSWEDIVKIMYNKQLDSYFDEVVRVVYTKDKSMRYVILKDKKGYFTYQLETIYQFDEEEWKYTYIDSNTLPAMWESSIGTVGGSIFENVEDLQKEMISTPEYKRYFK